MKKKTMGAKKQPIANDREQQTVAVQRIDLKVGFSCNNMCRFCVQGDKRLKVAPKSTSQLITIIEKGAENTTSIVFTGGEPTVHKDIIRLVERAAISGYRTIQMQTNGRAFANRNFCHEIVNAGVTEVSPALHGNIEALHDYLTRSPGSFRQTIIGIRNIRELGVPVILNSVITRSNYRNLPMMARLFIKLDVNQFQFAFVHALGSAQNKFASITPRKSLVAQYVHMGLDIARTYGVPSYTEAIPFCFMAGYENHVAEQIIPDTKVFDADLVIENYTEHRRKQAKIKGQQCPSCSFYHKCEGPWREYPEHYGWDEFIPR